MERAIGKCGISGDLRICKLAVDDKLPIGSEIVGGIPVLRWFLAGPEWQ